MIDEFADNLGVSTGVAVVLIVLIAIQVSLQIGSLIHLFTRPSGTVTPNRWVWALLILIGNGVGAIAYLVLAKSRSPQVRDPLLRRDESSAEPLPAAERTVDLLYGPKGADDR